MRKALAALRKDDGFTLAELIVAMFVIALVLAVSGAMVASTTRNYRLASGKASTQADGRAIIETVTRDLRVAVPAPSQVDRTFTTATADEMVFYSGFKATAARPNKIRYNVDPSTGCLLRTVEKPVVAPNGSLSYPGSGAGVESYCVAPSQVSTATPIFTYYTVSSAGAVSTTSDPTLMASVKVDVTLTAATFSEVNPTVVTQTVTLINQSNQIQARSNP